MSANIPFAVTGHMAKPSIGGAGKFTSPAFLVGSTAVTWQRVWVCEEKLEIITNLQVLVLEDFRRLETSFLLSELQS